MNKYVIRAEINADGPKKPMRLGHLWISAANDEEAIKIAENKIKELIKFTLDRLEPVQAEIKFEGKKK